MKLKLIISILFSLLFGHIQAQIAFHDAIALDSTFENRNYKTFLEILANYVDAPSPMSIDLIAQNFEDDFYGQTVLYSKINIIKGILDDRRSSIDTLNSSKISISIAYAKFNIRKNITLIRYKINNLHKIYDYHFFLEELNRINTWKDYKNSRVKDFIKIDSLSWFTVPSPKISAQNQILAELFHSYNSTYQANFLSLLNTDIGNLKTYQSQIEILKTLINATNSEIKSLNSFVDSFNSISLSSYNLSEQSIFIPQVRSSLPNNIIASETISEMQNNVLNNLNLTTKVVDAFAQFLAERIKKELTVAFFDKFKKKADEIIELQALFPNTYTMLNTRDIFKIPSMGQSWIAAFETDLQDILKNFEKMVNTYPKYEALRRETTFELAVMTANSFNMLTQNVHPAKILEFIDVEYGYNTSITPAQEKEYQKIISLVNLISKNIRQIESSIGDTNRVWISLQEFEKIDNEHKRNYFIELLVHQNPELFKEIKTEKGGKLYDLIKSNIDDFNYTVQRVIMSVDKIETQINLITNTINNNPNSNGQDFLDNVIIYFQLLEETIAMGYQFKHFQNPLEIYQDPDYQEFTEVAETVTETLQAIQVRNYGMAVVQFLQLIQQDKIEEKIKVNYEYYEAIEIILENIPKNNLGKIEYTELLSQLEQITEIDAFLDIQKDRIDKLNLYNIPNWIPLKTLIDLHYDRTINPVIKEFLIDLIKAKLRYTHQKLLKEIPEGNHCYSIIQNFLDKTSSSTLTIGDFLIELNNTFSCSPTIKSKLGNKYLKFLDEIKKYIEAFQRFKETELYQKLKELEGSDTKQASRVILKAIQEEIAKQNRDFGLILEKIGFYGTFISDILQADSTTQIKNIINRYASPVGSYKSKRLTSFSVDLNAYPGLQLGLEHATTLDAAEKQNSFAFRITAPIGLSFNFSHRKNIAKDKQKSAFSIFIPIVDIGAALSYRFEDAQTDTDTLSGELPENISLRQILSPGAYFVWNIANVPLSIKMGAQYLPALREITSEGNEISDSNAWFFGVSLSVDIPIFNLYRKTEEKYRYKPQKIKIF